MLQLASIYFVALCIFMPCWIDASAEKPAPVAQVSKTEIEEFVQKVMQALKTFDDQPSVENRYVLKSLNDELYHKLSLCKDLSTEEKTIYESGHKNVLRTISLARLKEMAQRWTTEKVGVVVGRYYVTTDFRTLGQDLALAQKIYPRPQQKPYAALCNDHGWTEPLAAFAKKDNAPLLKTIAERTQQHAQNNNHSIELAKRGIRCSIGTLRCFALRTPFENDHRKLMQNIIALAPDTSLHYIYAPEHASLVIASVLVGEKIYKQFAQANPLVHHSDVHVFADEHAAAFLEYVNDVATDNNKLKTKRITWNLAQFYKEHDEHQTRLQQNLGNAIAQTLPVKALQKLAAAYLTDAHPCPAPIVPLNFPG